LPLRSETQKPRQATDGAFLLNGCDWVTIETNTEHTDNHDQHFYFQLDLFTGFVPHRLFLVAPRLPHFVQERLQRSGFKKGIAPGQCREIRAL
jgi:hypothetical protein